MYSITVYYSEFEREAKIQESYTNLQELYANKIYANELYASQTDLANDRTTMVCGSLALLIIP